MNSILLAFLIGLACIAVGLFVALSLVQMANDDDGVMK